MVMLTDFVISISVVLSEYGHAILNTVLFIILAINLLCHKNFKILGSKVRRN